MGDLLYWFSIFISRYFFQIFFLVLFEFLFRVNFSLFTFRNGNGITKPLGFMKINFCVFNIFSAFFTNGRFRPTYLQVFIKRIKCYFLFTKFAYLWFLRTRNFMRVENIFHGLKATVVTFYFFMLFFIMFFFVTFWYTSSTSFTFIILPGTSHFMHSKSISLLQISQSLVSSIVSTLSMLVFQSFPSF